MHLDLVDHLRCPREHPGLDGTVALVCVPVRIDGRILHEAMLGCPTCHAQFAVIDGVMVLSDDVIVLGDGATGARPAPPDHGARGSADARRGAGAAGDVAQHADPGTGPLHLAAAAYLSAWWRLHDGDAQRRRSTPSVLVPGSSSNRPDASARR